MNKKITTLLFSITASAISIQSYACGLPPSFPYIGSCIGENFSVDCRYLNELALENYERELAEWENCDMNDPWYGAEEPGHWENREVTICTSKNVPIYGGHKWFRGERKWSQPGVGYDPGNVGWSCDDVFVTETLNNYIDYYDYDGVTQCEAYLGNPVRIDVKETCKTSVHSVFIPRP